MKKLFLFLIGCCFFTANGADFHIYGKVSGLEDGTLLYLRLVGPPSCDLDSLIVNNGEFEFKGEAPAAPSWVTLSIKNKFVALADFYLEAGDIFVDGERYKTRARGTKTNEEYLDYQTALIPMYGEVGNLHNELSVQETDYQRDSLRRELDELNRRLDAAELDYIRKYPASVVSLKLVGYKYPHLTGQKINEVLALLDSSLQQTPQAQSIKEYAARLLRSETGSVASDFSLETSSGSKFTLSEKRGKYVLLDFWASWCVPCRNSFPEVARLNEKYKGKNFEIIGVSVDRKTDLWKKALAEERCPWTQVCDPQGNVARLYAVSAIPLMVLVSPEGKIIKRFLNKEELTETLSGLFP
jgi:thiol-disulfide isomerase/thioredoxin